MPFDAALALRARDPAGVRRALAWRRWRRTCAPCSSCSERGAVTFDYGNNLRGQAQRGRRRGRLRHRRLRAAVHPAAVLRGQGAVPLGGALRRSRATSRRPTRRSSSSSPTTRALHRWIRMAQRARRVPGAAGAHLLARLRRARQGRAAVQRAGARAGEVTAPIVIGRDHLDCGSVASPNRETEAMRDGSDAIADWPILNALLNAVNGATWVSLHHGGGVGIGYSLHAGMVIVADGTAGGGARGCERVLTSDPGMGVVRHADAGYPEAIACARRARRRPAVAVRRRRRGIPDRGGRHGRDGSAGRLSRRAAVRRGRSVARSGRGRSSTPGRWRRRPWRWRCRRCGARRCSARCSSPGCCAGRRGGRCSPRRRWWRSRPLALLLAGIASTLGAPEPRAWVRETTPRYGELWRDLASHAADGVRGGGGSPPGERRRAARRPPPLRRAAGGNAPRPDAAARRPRRPAAGVGGARAAARAAAASGCRGRASPFAPASAPRRCSPWRRCRRRRGPGASWPAAASTPAGCPSSRPAGCRPEAFRWSLVERADEAAPGAWLLAAAQAPSMVVEPVPGVPPVGVRWAPILAGAALTLALLALAAMRAVALAVLGPTTLPAAHGRRSIALVVVAAALAVGSRCGGALVGAAVVARRSGAGRGRLAVGGRGSARAVVAAAAGAAGGAMLAGGSGSRAAHRRHPTAGRRWGRRRSCGAARRAARGGGGCAGARGRGASPPPGSFSRQRAATHRSESRCVSPPCSCSPPRPRTTTRCWRCRCSSPAAARRRSGCRSRRGAAVRGRWCRWSCSPLSSAPRRGRPPTGSSLRAAWRRGCYPA